jgi:protein-L-isoaspartate(D-aspartate) O-methyltransferase
MAREGLLLIVLLAAAAMAGAALLIDADPSVPADHAGMADAPLSAPADGASDESDATSDFEPPSPPGASQRADERRAMVGKQIERRRYGAVDIDNPEVLSAMRSAPRHAFVPEHVRSRAYQDTPLPIGHGQTISQPYIVALMTELLDLSPDEKVLEIGTGSGYQAAVLAHLTPNVYTVEIIEPLAERAKRALEAQEYETVNCLHADGYHGWKEHAPFDAIIVTCAAGHLPPPLWKQLKPGGRIVVPIGGPYEVQRLVRVFKEEDGSRRSETIMSVRFVPLTRKTDGDD